MSTFPYNEIAELLIDDSVTVSPDDGGEPEHRADAIMDGLSLTRLREYLLLQLTIETERCEDGFELPHTDRDRSGQQHRDEAAELVLS